MFKTIVIASVVLVAVAAASTAKDRNSNHYSDRYSSDVIVTDHDKTIVQTTPVTTRECRSVEVPVYNTVEQKGDVMESALIGMVIGGAAGHAITGKSKGAAAGVAIGGLIGADRGSSSKSRQVVSGYRTEQRCDNVVSYHDNRVQVYSHSTVKFQYEGRWYEVPFQK